MIPDKVIPVRILEKMQEGSYEELLNRVTEAIRTQRSKFGLEEDTNAGKIVFVGSSKAKIIKTAYGQLGDLAAYDVEFIDGPNARKVMRVSGRDIAGEAGQIVKTGKNRGKLIKVDVDQYGEIAAYGVDFLDGPNAGKMVSISSSDMDITGDVGFDWVVEHDVQPIATFHGYVVVLNSLGECYRAQYEEAEDRSIVFVKTESVEIPVFDSDKIEPYISEVASQAVNALLDLGPDKAMDQMRELMISLPENAVSAKQSLLEKLDDVGLQIKKIFGLDREWKKYFSENKLEIRKFLRGSLGQIENWALRPKHTKLYTDGVNEAELDGYKELVNRDLQEALKRINKLITSVQDNVTLYKDSQNTFRTKNEDFSLKKFDDFVIDFVEDLEKVRTDIVSVFESGGSCPACVGMLYDTIARHLVEYELAGKLIERLSNKIQTVAA